MTAEGSRRGRPAAGRGTPVAGQAGIMQFLTKKRPAEVAAQPDKENAADTTGGVGKKSKTAAASDTGENGAQVSVHDRYQKKTQLEHILLRPDSYVGSTEKQTQEHWIFEAESGRMVRRKVEYVPALYKIFDEILVNAADNRIRAPEQDTISVEVNTSEGWISVMNNGKGLPIVVHKEQKMYVPEMVFGNLLTSDNYDDSEKKVVGGRNGYGAKLTNIFSTKFIIETADSESGKRYKQIWENNMSKRSEPIIKKSTGENFTKVTFYPDLKRFQMTCLDEDFAGLLRRRVYDIAASVHLGSPHKNYKVMLDGKLIESNSFQDYVGLFVEADNFRVNQVINDRWEVAVGLTDGSGFQQVSFVNSINTSSGGTHVNYVADQVTNAVLERTGKTKSGGLSVKPAHVKSYLWIFVNCLIENPAFNSQTKEMLTSKRERFGSDCKMPEQMITAIMESGLIETLLEWSKAMGKSELAQHLNRSDFGMQKRLFGVPKLDDANKAGTKEGSQCTLILTEGDSAKALAVAGLSVVGRDYYGVFPLRGKLRNVRDLTVKQMLENKEIEQVMKILALDANTLYKSTQGLRYGSIMIMTDQDYDGSHIKGLIINFIQHWFPSLLVIPGFMKEFVTPIVKVSKGTETNTFFTVPEYEVWKEETNNGAGWKSKYYKGLGTSTGKEAKEYFADMENHEIGFTHSGPEEDDLIDMAFNSKRPDDRKKWISACEEGTCIDHNQSELTYTDFINKELVLFAKYDVQRAIPSLVDGLKPGQRKVIFGIFKKKVTHDIKVAQLSGYIAEHSSYHHGEVSLQGTIVAMAQNFVGSNNVNLLLPKGQFGTRLAGGKDHAASRYIFTKPSRACRAIFSEEDDDVLEYLNDEGLSIEPRWYCPVIPLVLLNGIDGIGTGWSTSIPNYNPREVIANIRRHLRGEPLEPLVPWYRGFKGTITPVTNTPGKFEVTGVATARGRVRLEISELPVKVWTQDFKEKLLDQLPNKQEEKRASITEIREYHTENSVHFVVSMTPDKLAEAGRKGFERAFKLVSSVSTTNMYLFDADGKIQKYETPEDIIMAFIPVRLEVYGKRKAYQIAKLEHDMAVSSNRLKFVQLVITDKLEVEKRKSNELCNEMHRKGLQTMAEINGKAPVKDASPEGYKYLLSMKMWSLTEDKVKALQGDCDKKRAALDELKGSTLESLWEKDLVKLEAALDACDADDAKEAEESARLVKKNMTGEDLLVNRQCVLVLTSNFEAKRVRASIWKAQKRGKKMAKNKGVMKEEDKGEKKEGEDAEGEDAEEDAEDEPTEVSGVFCCYDFDALLVFSEDGMVFKLQALDVPLAKRVNAKGAQLKDFLPELGDKRIATIVTVDQRALRDQSDNFIVLVSAHGYAKKVTLDRFRGLRPGKGMVAFKFSVAKDKLRWAHRASGQNCLVMASASGLVLRCSLGAEWKPGRPQGPGHCAMKVKPGTDDWIASCTISKLSDEEIKRYHKNREQKRLARQAALEASSTGVGAAPADAAGKDAAQAGEVDARKAGACDDDDSDNEMEVDAGKGADASPALGAAASPAPDAPDAADNADGAESDADADRDADDAESDGDRPGKEAGEEDGQLDAQMDTSSGKDEQCILLVTELGMGARLPLSCPRMTMQRRGGRGRRGIKLQEGKQCDNVVAVLCVSNKGPCEQTRKPRQPALIYFADKKAQKEKEESEAKENAPAAATTEGEDAGSAMPSAAADAEAQEKGPGMACPKGFALHRAQQEEAKKEFLALADDVQEDYMARADEEQRLYDVQMEENKKQEAEEILLGTAKGSISRVTVGSIPVVSSLRKGKIVVKVHKGDLLCTVALLSSIDEADDDGAPKLPAPAPAPSRPARPRLALAAAGAAPEAAPQQGAAPTASSSTTPAPQAGTPKKGKFTSLGSRQKLDKMLTSPVPNSRLQGGESSRRSNGKRLRGKTNSPAVEQLRSRLSGMALPLSRSSSRLSMSGSGTKRLSAQNAVRLSIVKPKLRLLSKARKHLIVRSLDVNQWAAMAAAAAAAPSTGLRR